MKALNLGLVALLSLVSVTASGYPMDAEQAAVKTRVALDDAGKLLRGADKSINYIGVDQNGRLCELQLSENRGGYMYMTDDEVKVDGAWKKSGLRLAADSIYNPYYAVTNDKAKVERNTNEIKGGIQIVDISVSSGIDDSRAELHVERDTVNRMRVNGKDIKDRFVSGWFRFDRGDGADKVKTCIFNLEVTGDQLTTTNTVLGGLEIGRKF